MFSFMWVDPGNLFIESFDVLYIIESVYNMSIVFA